jgi:cell division protein FtsL
MLTGPITATRSTARSMMAPMKRVWYRSPTIFVAGVTAAITLAALAHVWVHLQVIALGYDISRETQLRHDLSEMNQRLSLELRTRLDLTTIERTAKAELKMAPPDPQSVRVLVRP